MKPTQVKELFANIKNTIVSFFSILMFVALGIGVFLGISWSGPALQNAADNMFREGQFHNIQVQFPYGLTDENLDELSEIEGVTRIEPERQSYQVTWRDGNSHVVKVQSLGQDIDVPLVVEGELPQKADEMAFHVESAAQLGVSVGDVITFTHDAEDDDDLPTAADIENMKGAEDAEGTEGAEDTEGAGDAESAEAPAEERPDTSDGMQYLSSDTYKVTALINSADYAAKSKDTYGFSNAPSGSVDALAWVPDEAFDAAAFRQGYPVVNVQCEELAGLPTFSTEYDQISDQIEERVSELGKQLAVKRYDELHDNAQSKVDEAEKLLNDTKQKIADGEQQISDGETQLEQGRKELDDAIATGEAELSSAYDQLMQGEALKAEGEAKLEEGKAKLEQGRSMLAQLDDLIREAQNLNQDMQSYKSQLDSDLAAGKITQAEYDALLDEYGAQITSFLQQFNQYTTTSAIEINHATYDSATDIINALIAGVEDMVVEVEGESMTVAQARQKIAQYESEVAAGQNELDQKTAELNAGWERYNAGQQELEAKKAEGEQKLADGEAELEKAKQQVTEAQAQVEENEPKLDAAKEKVAALKKYDWSVLPRAYNAGVEEVDTFSSVTHRLSISMAALFIIVGLLVTYFAVSRIVNEQVTQIGTKKALGFRKGEITKSFLLYSGIAVFAGAIIGTAVGYTLVEGIIGGTLGSMFAFGTYPAFFGFPLFLAMTLLELGLVLAATYLACRSILKQHAVELLRGAKPPAGKERFYEKWALWDRMPLLLQTIVNNCMNDRRRVLSTIVGVAGCTALIVTAITLNNDVLKSYDKHYSNVYGFNAIAYVENGSEDAADNVESALQEAGASTARVFMKTYLMEQPNDKSGAMRIIVPFDEDAFAQRYHVNPISDGPFDLSAKGAWVSHAYAEHFGAKVGDIITVDGGDGTKHEVPILGFYEFWLTYHEMVMGADYYREEFGDVSPSAIFVQTGDVPVDDVAQAVSGVAGFDSIFDDAAHQKLNFDMFSQVSGAVVAIYLALAVLMAIVVLLNLNVMFIDEKKRELIVLMINGFSVKDARHYISYDSIVLTAVGIIAGIVLGCIMGSVTVGAIEPATGVFWKVVDAPAVIIGIVGSGVLAFIMSQIALRRIPKFKLTDINRM